MEMKNRRTFLLAAAGAVAIPQAFAGVGLQPGNYFGSLPYELNHLEPVVSARTVGIHYGRHHKGYADALRKLITGTSMEGAALDQIVRQSAASNAPEMVSIFNNAAQVWNHEFYWQSLSATGGGRPGANVMRMIEASHGSFENLRKELIAASLSQFASGWVWLVWDKKASKVAITKTGNAMTPIVQADLIPLAVIDVWEHAYYLDYENRRAEYATAVIDKLLNWRNVEAGLSKV